MRNVIRYGIILALLVVSITFFRDVAFDKSRNLNGTNDINHVERVGYQTAGYVEMIVVEKDASIVKRGDDGFIKIRGRSNDSFLIKTSYIIGDEIINIRKSIKADRNGIATFTWKVSKDSVPGTYPIIISNGLSSIKLSHTVL